MQGMTLDDLQRDERTASAVIHQLQIVGEALNGVSVSFQQAHPDVPWREAIAMRHHLVHSYFRTDLAVVWRTVRDDLPTLVPALERAIATSGRTGG